MFLFRIFLLKPYIIFFSHELTNFANLDVENFIELNEIALKGNSISKIRLNKSTSKLV